jgi:hypothetical protein
VCRLVDPEEGHRATLVGVNVLLVLRVLEVELRARGPVPGVRALVVAESSGLREDAVRLVDRTVTALQLLVCPAEEVRAHGAESKGQAEIPRESHCRAAI